MKEIDEKSGERAKLKNGTRQDAQAGLTGARRKKWGRGGWAFSLQNMERQSAANVKRNLSKLGGTRIFAVFTAMPN
jgi:hypothetical protein